MEKKVAENEVNKLVSISMKMDSRQQILLLIALAYRYSYFLSEAVRKGEVENGEMFFKENFIKPCKLVIGYLRANRKIARKIAKDLKGAAHPLAKFYEAHEDDMSVMPVLAVICLFLALVTVSGKTLVKGDWEMIYLYPTVGYAYGFTDSEEYEGLKDTIDIYLENELEMLSGIVNTVKKQCPVQNRNSPPLTDEFIADLLDTSSYDLERLFDKFLPEYYEGIDPDDLNKDDEEES